MPLQNLICAELRVADIDAALGFNEDVFGLRRTGTEDGRVFLTCGTDGGAAQLALSKGGTGVASFALGVDHDEDLDRVETRLRALGVDSELRHDAAPGQPKAMRFTLPTGSAVDLVPLPERVTYPHPVHDGGHVPSGVAPRGIDHITLAFADSALARATASLLTEALDFAVSDVMLDRDGDWLGAWLRAGERHHDVGLLRCQPGASLHHLAWTLAGADHMTAAADALAGRHLMLETGPGRHGVGGNLYAYFWTPEGNRYELSADMPGVAGGRRTPLVREAASFNAFSAWGAPRPDSFGTGS